MAETVKERLDSFRQKAGAKEYKGHGYMSLYRFMEDTRHMVIMDILTSCSGKLLPEMGSVRSSGMYSKSGDTRASHRPAAFCPLPPTSTCSRQSLLVYV